MNSTLVRSFHVPVRTSMALLLVLVTMPFGFLTPVAFAAEVSITEVVSGVPNGVVYAEPGQTVSFPINVTAGGYLLPGVTQAVPAMARINTEYLLAPWGSSSFTLSAPCAFWPKDAMGRLDWNGSPNPYVVQATIYVAAGVPRGDYVVPIYTMVATPVIGTPSLMLNDYYKDNFIVHVELPADTTPPVTRANLSGVSGLGGWYVSNVEVTLAATDAGTGVSLTEYSLDQGSTWQRYTTPFMVSDDGVSTVHYRSSDVAGNTEEYKYVQTAIDKTDPVVEITTVAEGAIYPSATLDYLATDASPGSGVASSNMTIDGVRVDPGATVLAEGTHTVAIGACDFAGRQTTHSHTFTVHSGGPRIAVASPTPGPHRTSQSFVFDVTDEIGVASEVSNPELGHVWSEEGSYTATVLATDSLGNCASASVDFMIDSTNPATIATLSGIMGQNGWWKSAANVDLNASDPVSGGVCSGVAFAQISVDGGAWSQCVDAVSIGQDGVHTVEFYSVDAAGNQEALQSVRVGIDTVAPTVTADVLGQVSAEGGYYVGPTSISVSGQDDGSQIAQCEYNLNDGGWVLYTSPVALPDGRNVVEVRASDIAGNLSAETTLELAVDASPPVTTAHVTGTRGLNAWYTEAVEVSFSADDGTLGSGVAFTDYSLDDGLSWIRKTGSTITIPGPGIVSIHYRSSDIAGNLEDARSQVVKIDLSDPVASIMGVAEGARMPSAVIDYSADDFSPGSDIALVTCTLDDVVVAAGTPVVVEGSHHIVVTATDQAGRSSSTSRTFVIDHSAPTITISTPRDGGAFNTEQVVDVSVDDDDPATSWSSSPVNGALLSAEGVHTVRVEASDSLGNAALKTASCVIDRTSPGVDPELSGTPGLSGWWRSTVSVALNPADPVSGGVFSGVAACMYAIDSGPLTAYLGPFTVEEGKHTVHWAITDRAGNSSTGNLTVNVDATAPSAISTSPTAGMQYLYGRSLTLGFVFSDLGSGISSQAAFFNGVLATSGQVVGLTQPGLNTLRLQASDVAGNPVDATIPFTVAFGGGMWLMPAAGETTWKAGHQLKAQVQVNDFALNPTDGAVVMYVVRIDGTVLASGTGVARYAGGVPYYEFTARTDKEQLGTMVITASFNDNVTTLTKTLTLVR